MSNIFTHNNVVEFLVEQGADYSTSNTIASQVIVSARTVSVGAEIKDQSVSSDFTSYTANLLANGGAEITVKYNVKKLGTGFFEYTVNVEQEGQAYSVSNLVYSPLVTNEIALDTNVAVDEPFVAEKEPVVTEEPIVIEEPVAVAEPVVSEEVALVDSVEVGAEESTAVDAPVVTEEPVAVAEPKKAGKKKKAS